jgi:hypothetical protein
MGHLCDPLEGTTRGTFRRGSLAGDDMQDGQGGETLRERSHSDGRPPLQLHPPSRLPHPRQLERTHQEADAPPTSRSCAIVASPRGHRRPQSTERRQVVLRPTTTRIDHSVPLLRTFRVQDVQCLDRVLHRQFHPFSTNRRESSFLLFPRSSLTGAISRTICSTGSKRNISGS